MNFEEIFKETGLYRGDDFAEGFCFEVDDNGSLHALHYRNKNDIFPMKNSPLVYRGLFKKTFFKVLNTNQLFNKNDNHAK